jgi:hypothetical protein
LRTPLAGQLDQTDALLVVGDGFNADPVITQCRTRGLPIFPAALFLTPIAWHP